MLKLLSAVRGQGRMTCDYLHDFHGRVRVVTTWGDSGADIIRFETDRDRARNRDFIKKAQARAAAARNKTSGEVG